MNGYDIFKKWYVDGRLYYYNIIDSKNPKKGIQELRYIDPRKIKRIKEHKKERHPESGAIVYKGTEKYYLYNQSGLQTNTSTGGGSQQGVRIAYDSVTYCDSGITDSRNNIIYSWLHKAIKPLNQLQMLEDAVVIYRLSRAPERRIFYVDVGNLPKAKAEQYLNDMMTKHKNKLTYNAETGEVKDQRRFMTMLEDYWFPRRGGGQGGTEVTTLPGGQSLGEMDDVEYFKRKLYKSLNVPISRLETENQFNLGRASEITRDEVKYSKFITRLRNRFTILFDELLEKQLALKKIISRNEWKEIKKYVRYDFNQDNHFAELKQAEILENRMNILDRVEQYVGEYYSREWVKKNVLQQSEQEIEDMQKEMDKEAEEQEDEMDVDDQENVPPQQQQSPDKPDPEKTVTTSDDKPQQNQGNKPNNDPVNKDTKDSGVKESTFTKIKHLDL